MLDKIKGLLAGEEDSLDITKDGAASIEELQVACGVLLLEMSGRDQDYAPEEVQAIFSAMADKFQIEDQQEIYKLLEKSQGEIDKAGKIDQFIETINKSYTEAQKIQIVEMAKSVMQADGAVEKDEKKFLTQIATRLQLSKETIASLL